MEARAYLRHARISPRKVQIVLDLIRKQDCEKAMAILRYTPKAACEPLEKLLKSAKPMRKTISAWIEITSTSPSAMSPPALR